MQLVVSNGSLGCIYPRGMKNSAPDAEVIDSIRWTLQYCNAVTAPVWLFIRITYTKISILFSFVLESHVVECSMESFIHRDYRLIYLHLSTDCFMTVVSLRFLFTRPGNSL